MSEQNPRVVFITGAGSGMGHLAARRALQAGWRVAALDINQAGLDQLGSSDRLLKLVVDVGDFDVVLDAARRVERDLGPIFRVVNAAGIMPLGLALEQSPSLTRKIMEINYLGLVHVTHATLPLMLKRGQGEFVSFSSMAGIMPTIYVGAYDASKFAVTAYTEVLANENQNMGVSFCCVCPPMVATPLLQQAKDTVWPRLFNLMPPLEPDHVLDEIEDALRANRFWVLPGPLTPVFGLFRRMSPAGLWWFVRTIERFGPAEALFKSRKKAA